MLRLVKQEVVSL